MARGKSRTLADTTTDDLAKFVEDAADELTMLNTRVPAKMLRKIKIYTVVNGTTIRQFVNDALMEKLESLGERIE